MTRAYAVLDADRRRSIRAALVWGVGWARIYGRPWPVMCRRARPDSHTQEDR